MKRPRSAGWMWRGRLAALAACGLSPGCSGKVDDGLLPPPGSGCAAGEVVCEGAVAKTCDGAGGFSSQIDCGAGGCTTGVGCPPCAASCAAGAAVRCVDGAPVPFECDPVQGMTCEPDGCKGACSPATLAPGSTGCEFWPTVTMNPVWSSYFAFGVALSSTSEETTHVLVEGPSGFSASLELGPLEARTVELPWVQPLKGSDSDEEGKIGVPVANVRGGAYRVRTDRPVVAYQFSPLEYENKDDPPGCPDLVGTRCLALTNDASLLLPTHLLGARYDVAGYHAWLPAASPGAAMGDLIAITATRDATAVVITAGPATASLDGEGVSLAPGGTSAVVLQRGEALQLFTRPESESRQWAGSVIEASHPVQVLTGVPCTFIPTDSGGCDHIEETVLPSFALGSAYVLTAPRTPAGGIAAQLVRVHAVAEGTNLVFDPPNAGPAGVLARGDTLELAAVDVDFVVRSEPPVPFAVTHYLRGYTVTGAGDPSQSIAVPLSRFHPDATFFAPESFAMSFVNVVARAGQEVELDGSVVPASAFTAVGGSGLAVARLPLSGASRHRARSAAPLGVVVYGYGDYASYLVPAGLGPPSAGP